MGTRKSSVPAMVVGLLRFPTCRSTPGSRQCFSSFTPRINKRRLAFPGETSSGWERSLRIVMTTTSTETGGGLMQMPAFSGLTGETTSPMTTMGRIVTYMEYRNPIFQAYRDYFWNDSDCTNDVAHYICVKDCADCPDQGTTAAA